MNIPHSCSTQRTRWSQTNTLIALNQNAIVKFDQFFAGSATLVSIAQAAVDAASLNVESWVEWLNIVTTEQLFYKGVFDEAKARLATLLAAKAQLEAYLIENCGGLDVTEAPSTDIFTT